MAKPHQYLRGCMHVVVNTRALFTLKTQLASYTSTKVARQHYVGLQYVSTATMTYKDTLRKVVPSSYPPSKVNSMSQRFLLATAFPQLHKHAETGKLVIN